MWVKDTGLLGQMVVTACCMEVKWITRLMDGMVCGQDVE